jgi:hypothetical protein
MRKIIVSTLFLFIGLFSAVAQDVITMKTGDELKVKIIRLNPKDVVFSPNANKNDTISILRDEVAKLWYQSGTTIYLSDNRKHEEGYTATTDSLYNAGMADALKYYSGYKSASTGVLISGLAFPYNLIPAIACSATPPKDQNLGYKDKKLMENYSYNQGYINQAHKIKKHKVWKNYAIGSGVMIAFYVLMSAVAVTTMVY